MASTISLRSGVGSGSKTLRTLGGIRPCKVPFRHHATIPKASQDKNSSDAQVFVPTICDSVIHGQGIVVLPQLSS